MAKYIAIIVSLIFLVFSVNSVVHGQKTEDPSEEIIKKEDAEEGYNFLQLKDPHRKSGLRRRFLDYLVCPDPKTDDNMVTKISGNPPHMDSKVQVTCNAGKHFTGRESNKTMARLLCLPLPNPNYEVEWQDMDDYHLMYNFNCTSDHPKTSERRFLEALVCPDPKTDDNTVTKVSGDPPHMSSEVNVTCNAGKHFIGKEANRTMVTVQCLPLPHPCMCMAAWSTRDNFQLMYDFNCTTDIEDNIDNEKTSKPVQDDLPIYPLQDKDDPQCPDPTPIRGTMKILHGHPFSYGCNVLLTCDPGLVFEDGKSVWNLTCLGLSVLPPKCVWVPMHDGKPTCKDELQCPDPSPVRGTVKVISGKPYTDGCKVSLRCDPGLIFNDGKTVWNLTCVPVPHIPPALVWIPQYNGTPTCKEPDLTDTSKTIAEPAKQETTQTDNKDDKVQILDDPETDDEQETIVSRDVNDDLQCPDPTPVRGTMKILHGQPYSFACNVLLTCDPGLVFPDGESVWNLTCLAIPVTPPALVWVPVNLGKPVCKDSPQCPDPTPVRGTLKVLSGTPYSDGCDVMLTCDPGLVFPDGKSVWNLSCTPLPVLPNKCIWLPQYDGKPTCKEPEETEHSLSKEETEIHEDETNSEPKNTYDEVAVKNEITDTYGNKDNINSLEIDTYGPEEDLDGTFHENYIENRDSEESKNGDMNDKNDEIVVPSEWEENEEFTNVVSGTESNPDFVEIYDEIINNHDDERTEYEDSFMENDNLNGNTEEETSVQTNEIENQSEEDGESLENETEENFSEPGTSLEEESNHAFPEIEENTVEESDNFENSETEDLHNISDEETENQQINEEVDVQEETEEENEGNEESESEEENESATEVGMNEEEEADESKEDTEAEMGEEEETENEEEEQAVEENENEELQEIEEAESNEEIEPENDEELEEQQQNNEESDEDVEEEEEGEESGENMKLENDEEDEEDTEDEEESNLFHEVHPLQPPSIKQPSIIYAALQESSLFDKEENEEETEENNSDSLIFGEVEAPGSLLDIQLAPVEASKEQIQTNENDCSLPAETGPCRAYFRRYFFNSNSGECDTFVYGGCQGNGNNFKTLDDCKNTCVTKIVNL